MPIPPVNPGANALAPQSAPSQQLGEEEFLNLLMTQLGNQDPLNPMQSQDFAQQVASMNTVQQLMGANERLDSLMLGVTSMNNQSAVQMVGQNVIARGNAFEHAKDEVHDLRFDLGTEADEVTIRVLDEQGVEQATIEAGEGIAGQNVFTWNGRNEEGSPLPEGDYTFEVIANKDGVELTDVTTYISGVVEELRFDNGYPTLLIGGAEVTMDSILRVLGDAADADAVLEAEAEVEAQDESIAPDVFDPLA